MHHHSMANRITHERLQEILHYNPETGVFTWRALRKKCTPGKQVGTLKVPQGYWQAKLDYRLYYLHRLAWFYMTGEWPDNEVDHINRNKSDNRWCNLRQATTKQNQENINLRCVNTSGCTGVHWYKASSKWCARIIHEGGQISLGYFIKYEDAVKARRDAEDRLYTHHIKL